MNILNNNVAEEVFLYNAFENIAVYLKTFAGYWVK